MSRNDTSSHRWRTIIVVTVATVAVLLLLIWLGARFATANLPALSHRAGGRTRVPDGLDL